MKRILIAMMMALFLTSNPAAMTITELEQRYEQDRVFVAGYIYGIIHTYLYANVIKDTGNRLFCIPEDEDIGASGFIQLVDNYQHLHGHKLKPETPTEIMVLLAIQNEFPCNPSYQN